MLLVLALLTIEARAELLGTHPHRNGTVHLMTDLCREGGPRAGQHARQTGGGRERHGCWGVDGAGNPVVTWSDGSELVLDGNKARMSRRMGGLLEQRAEAHPGAPAAASFCAGSRAARASAAQDAQLRHYRAGLPAGG